MGRAGERKGAGDTVRLTIILLLAVLIDTISGGEKQSFNAAFVVFFFIGVLMSLLQDCIEIVNGWRKGE